MADLVLKQVTDSIGDMWLSSAAKVLPEEAVVQYELGKASQGVGGGPLFCFRIDLETQVRPQLSYTGDTSYLLCLAEGPYPADITQLGVWYPGALTFERIKTFWREFEAPRVRRHLPHGTALYDRLTPIAQTTIGGWMEDALLLQHRLDDLPDNLSPQETYTLL